MYTSKSAGLPAVASAKAGAPGWARVLSGSWRGNGPPSRRRVAGLRGRPARRGLRHGPDGESRGLGTARSLISSLNVGRGVAEGRGEGRQTHSPGSSRQQWGVLRNGGNPDAATPRGGGQSRSYWTGIVNPCRVRLRRARGSTDQLRASSRGSYVGCERWPVSLGVKGAQAARASRA